MAILKVLNQADVVSLMTFETGVWSRPYINIKETILHLPDLLNPEQANASFSRPSTSLAIKPQTECPQVEAVNPEAL